MSENDAEPSVPAKVLSVRWTDQAGRGLRWPAGIARVYRTN